MTEKNNYKSWEINLSDFPQDALLQKQLEFLVGFAILAPSGHNSQPWQFSVGRDFIDISVESERSLAQSDPEGRQLSIAIGCAIENLRVAADYFGFETKIEYFPEGPSSFLFARMFFANKKAASIDDKHLVFSIPKRRTNRNKYEDRPLPQESIESIRRFSDENLHIEIVTELDQRNVFAELASNAQVEAMDSSSFREELSHYVKPSTTKEKFGMTGATLLMPAFLSYFASWLIQRVNLSRLSKKQDEALLKRFTPAFLVISTEKDDKISWMKAGELFERVWLMAEQAGISCSPMAGCVQDRSYREKVREVLRENYTPQIFSRIGYATKIAPHSPRFLAEEIFLQKTFGLSESLHYTMNKEEKLINLIASDLKREKIQIGRFLINYVVAGSGPNVLLLHGLNMGWGQWYPNITELSKHFRVFAIDLPGAGDSTTIDSQTADFTEHFVEVVEKFIGIKNIDKLSIIGHSTGGWVALKLVLREKTKVDKIVLLSPLGFSEYTPHKYRMVGFYLIAKLLSKTVMKPTRQHIKKFIKSVLHDVSTLKEEFIDYYHESLQRDGFVPPLLLINRISGFFKVRKEFVLLDELSKVNCPTLIITGEKDPIVTPHERHSRAFQLIPGVRWELFLNTGHVPSIERSNEFNEVVIKFLKS